MDADGMYGTGIKTAQIRHQRIIPTRINGLKNVITIKVLFRTLARYSLWIISLRLRMVGNCFNKDIVYRRNYLYKVIHL